MADTNDNSGADMGSLLNTVLENPEAMKRISELAKTFMSGSGGDVKTSAAQSEHNETPEKNEKIESDSEKSVSENAAASVMSHGLNKKENDQRLALLCALKPYLGKDRREKVDYIIKMMRLLSIADLGTLFK